MFLLRSCLRGNGGRSSSSTAKIISAGAPPRILTSSYSPSSALLASRSTVTPPSPLVPPSATQPHLLVHDVHRAFSSSSGNNGGDDKKNGGGRSDDEDFFLRDEASLPAPPSYVRDEVTGKWTSETHSELSSRDRKLLNLDAEEKSEAVMKRVEERWRAAAADAEGAGGGSGEDVGGPPIAWNAEHERLARRVQEQRLALGTVGRDPAGVGRRGGDADDGAADAAPDQPLTPRELQALKAYAAQEHGVGPADFGRLVDDDPDLIPHNAVASGPDGATASKQFFDADLDLAHLRPGLHRRAFGAEGAGPGDDPFADLLPADLNPARKVNRRHAKLLPRRLLHHNNLALLRRYTTPGGKIMNRVQSRLGAKDQRKIAKLVKRARHLGLIPYMGQWKFEDHGDRVAAHVNGGADDDTRDWEEDLEKRGLWPLADETELVKRFYDVDKMMDHIAGPKGGKKREELDRLVGAMGHMELNNDGSKVDGGSS